MSVDLLVVNVRLVNENTETSTDVLIKDVPIAEQGLICRAETLKPLPLPVASTHCRGE